jgi:hypothetical protein
MNYVQQIFVWQSLNNNPSSKHEWQLLPCRIWTKTKSILCDISTRVRGCWNMFPGKSVLCLCATFPFTWIWNTVIFLLRQEYTRNNSHSFLSTVFLVNFSFSFPTFSIHLSFIHSFFLYHILSPLSLSTFLSFIRSFSIISFLRVLHSFGVFAEQCHEMKSTPLHVPCSILSWETGCPDLTTIVGFLWASRRYRPRSLHSTSFKNQDSKSFYYSKHISF